MPMLIAVDVGNSRIKLGRFGSTGALPRGRTASVVTTGRLLPEPIDTLELPLTNRAGEFDAKQLAAWCDTGILDVTAWLVSSVHRGAAERFAEAVGSLAKTRKAAWPLRLLNFRDVPLVIAIEAPELVGIDRLLAAAAAEKLRRRDRAAIVVDLGTATTVDLVTAAGEFAGGAILPGMAMSARALEEQTDALPHVAIDGWPGPPQSLGKATVPAIMSGLFWGTLGAIHELVEQLSIGLAAPPEVFVTGGTSRLFAEQLVATHKMAVQHIPHLVLRGIALVGSAEAAWN
jgi:type III pantothenate kinase